MIKIIGEDGQHVKQCSCKNCAAKLEYTLSEIREKKVSDYTGDTEIVRYLACPRCGHEIKLSRWW